MDVNDLTTVNKLEVERALAATAVMYPAYTIQQCGWLRPEAFNDVRVKSFWKFFLDLVSVDMEDGAAGTAAAEATFKSGIHTDIVLWSSNLRWGTLTPQACAREIARRTYLQDVSIMNSRLAKAVGSQDDVSVKQVVGEMNALTPGGGAVMPSAADTAERFEKALMGGNRTVKTKLKLDAALGGLERQTEIIVAARPSMGKTTMVFQIARNVADMAKTVAFFSLEMSAVSLWGRAACPAAGTTWRDVLAGNVTKEQLELLKVRNRELAVRYEKTLHIEDTPQTTDSIWQHTATLKPDLVVVDHLRLLKDRYGRNENQRVGYCSLQLKEIAKAFNVPVLVAAQLNRALEGRQDKRPILSDLRESGEIEENADVVLMIYRDDYYSPFDHPIDEHLTEIWIRKFRDGPLNIRVDLMFDVKTQSFQ